MLSTLCSLWWFFFFYQSHVIGEPIQNGIALDNGEAAFIVGIAIMRNDQIGNNICTGTLISPNCILTAATRCTEIRKGEVLVAKLRKEENGPAIRVVPVTAKTYAEWYLEKNKKSATGRDSTDVAILMLSERITNIHPAITTTPSGDEWKIGAKHKFIGWGYDAMWRQSPLPLKTTLTVLDPDVCKERTKKALGKNGKFTWSDGQLCAETEPKVMLVKGDNGGPVFTKNYMEVFGIFTRQAGMKDPLDFKPEHPNLILLLDDFKLFINEMIRNGAKE